MWLNRDGISSFPSFFQTDGWANYEMNRESPLSKKSNSGDEEDLRRI